MADPVTTRFALPLMQAAQAQKHVTLNEALMRLDGVSNLVLQSLGGTTPPDLVVEGQCHGVGAGAVNAWAGQGGKIAIGSGGGWIFVAPSAGLRAKVLSGGRDAVYSGEAWIEGAVTLARSGAGMVAGLAEMDVTVTAGTSITTPLVIPANSMVIGTTARVIDAITGSATSWALGTSGALDRFGRGLGKAAGSFGQGILGSPLTYYDLAPLILTASGGSFTAGKVRIAVHWWELRLPD